MKVLNRRRERSIANAVIRDPAEHTVMDEHGGVRSVQAADVTMPIAELDSIWSSMHLERLARTYWKYLSRVFLGLIRVSYTETERAVVLITRPLVLLRFHAPEYELSADRGIVRWRIRDGILVDKPGRGGDGYLELDVRRYPDEGDRATVHVEVEIANFYPAVATWVRAGSTPRRSRASTSWSPTGSCARWPSSSSRNQRSGGLPRSTAT